MKHGWIRSLAVLMGAGLLAWSCSRTDDVLDNPGVSSANEAQMVVTPEQAEDIPVAGEENWVFPETSLMESPVIQEGSAAEEFKLIDDGTEAAEETDPAEALWGDDAQMSEGADRPCNIGGLSPMQKRALKRAHRRYCRCACGIHQAIHQINQQIIANANQQLRKLVNKLRSGQLTPQQFAQKLQKLIKRTRHALKSNPQKQRLLKALRHCKRRYARAAHRILNDRQFHQWLHCPKARKCRCHDRSGPRDSAAD